MKFTKFSTIALAITSITFFSACNNADKSGTSGSTDSSAVTTTSNTAAIDTAAMPDTAPAVNATQSADAMLISDLVGSMTAGIAVMKLGEQKATDPAVKALATKLTTTHTKLNDELKALAAKKGWTVPQSETPADVQKREAMANEEVPAFQKDWLAALRERHETNIGKLENARPTDADVKAAGEKGLPVIKSLLADIKKVQSSLK